MHSMTGFGRGSASTDLWQASVEISSVNRKQAEILVQAPRELGELEGRIRKAVLAAITRGRIQVSIHLDRALGAPAAITVDPAMAVAFDQAFRTLSEAIGRVVLPSAADYLRQPGIFNTGSHAVVVEEAWLAVQPALLAALAGLVAMRAAEGSHLKSDFLARLAKLGEFTTEITRMAPGRMPRQRELLDKRLRDAGLDLDLADERVTRELALFADRCDISEELTRLNSHLARFHEYLDASEAPGRALDFLCQEMFREFNTIGSKANDTGIARAIVEAKTELEKVREQVQNLE